jgi:uncharacterized protein (DUF952 family)
LGPNRYVVSHSNMGDVYDTHPILYQLVDKQDVAENAWNGRLSWTSAFTKLDDPKYFILQTGEQLAGKAASSFAGKEDLMLLTWKVESMCEEADIKVKFEDDGEPRAYGDFIPYACLSAPPALLALKDGKHVLPLFGAEAAAAAALLEESAIHSDANTSDDDGLDAFDQHTYDLDDDGNDALDPS